MFTDKHTVAPQKLIKFISASLILWASLSGLSHAYFPLLTDNTGTQGASGNQLEISYSYIKNSGVPFDENGISLDRENAYTNLMPATYTRGLTDDIDLFAGVVRQLSATSGWMNSSVGVKWRFLGEKDKGWSFAVKPALYIPVSTSMQQNGLGNAKTNWGMSMIGSYLHESYEVHLNASYTSNQYQVTQDSEAIRTNLWSLSVAPVWVMNEQWKLALDAGIQSNPSYSSNTVMYGQIAGIYAPVENVQIGLGLMASPAINSPSKEYNLVVSTGITWQF